MRADEDRYRGILQTSAPRRQNRADLAEYCQSRVRNIPRLTIKIMRQPTIIKPMSSNPRCQFQVTTTEFRRHLGTILDWVEKSNERIMITVRGQNASMPLAKEEQ